MCQLQRQIENRTDTHIGVYGPGGIDLADRRNNCINGAKN